ncbi:hypothetical protein AB0P36_34410 [Streptomyces flavidovirens]|uniref:Vgb family protein n=1 Tax=Streptomyces flavidovirens TaxID=67298 RepID=UPI00343BFEFA
MHTRTRGSGTLRHAVAAAMTVAALTGGVLASAPTAVAAVPAVDCTVTPLRCPVIAPIGGATDVALDGTGKAYVSTNSGNLYEVVNLQGDDKPGLLVTGLGDAVGLALDGEGHAYVVNRGGVLHRVDLKTRAVTPVATGLGHGVKVALDRQGHAYVADLSGGILWRIALADGSKTPVATPRLKDAKGVALDGRGRAYVSSKSGSLYEVDLDNGFSRRVLVDWPDENTPGVAVTGSGTVVLSTRGGHLYEVDPESGRVRLAARNLGDAFGMTVDVKGDVYITQWAQGKLVKVTGAVRPGPSPGGGLEVTAVPAITAVPGGKAVPRVKVTNRTTSAIGSQDIRLTLGPAHVGWDYNVIYQDRQGGIIETPCTVDRVDRTTSLCRNVPLELAPGQSTELRTEVQVSKEARPCELPSLAWHIADKRAKSDWLMLNRDGSRPRC